LDRQMHEPANRPPRKRKRCDKRQVQDEEGIRAGRIQRWPAKRTIIQSGSTY
jgi:hypothetical protein